MHTGQHYDRELSEVFFEELGLPEPRHRLDLHTADVGRDDAGDRARDRARRSPTSSSSTATRTRRSRARARPRARRIPLAHVEAGLRSGDLSMPEEHARIEVDRIAWLLFCPNERSRATLLERGRARAGSRRRRRHGRGEHALRADRARALPDPVRAADVRRRDGAPAGERRTSRGSAASSRALNRIEERVVFPAHPRTRAQIEAERLELDEHVRVTEPLGYLEFASLASQARVIATDSGGLQKEAYWYGVPCVTMRPSTEWVDTVEVGANVLVDDDPDAIVAAVARRDDAREPARCSTATAAPPGGSRSVLARYDPRPMKRDVAIVGAGYVGVPLAQVFADAGQSRRPRRRGRRRASRG